MKKKQAKSAMWGRLILAVCALLLCAGIAFAAAPKISHDLQQGNSSEQVDVIVQYKQVPTAGHHQKVISRGGKLRSELGQFQARLIRCRPPR